MFPISTCLRLVRQSSVKYFRCSCASKSKNESNKLQKLDIEEDLAGAPKYDPKNVTKEDMRWRTPWHQKEGNYYTMLRMYYAEKSRSRVLKTLHTPINLSPSAIKNWWARTKEGFEIGQQAYLPQRNQALGDELAAAHFVVSRGGAVKFFNEDVWIKADEDNNYDLPRFFETDKVLQAMDCSDMTLYYEGLANFADLQNVQWLSINGCEHMDDWCLDKISNIFSHSLIYLDIRNCSNISYRGLSAVQKLENLKILYVDDLLRSTSYEYTCLLLEELMPNLQIRSDPIKFDI